VSRAAFYEHFADKEACLLAAYDHFAAAILRALAVDVGEEAPWSEFIEATVGAYLATLEDDLVAGRAFIVEMDGAGPVARGRRRDAVRGFAAIIAQRHAAIRSRNFELGSLPDSVYLTLALGVREHVHEALEAEPTPNLRALAPDVVLLMTAVIEGAAAANAALGRLDDLQA
jgi:AcrR family transcriptional regulator